MSPPQRPVVRAAGGVLWRRENGELQIVLVHRPRYDDWTLPKGKVLAGEQLLLAAVREVAEETGATVAVGRRLQSISYRVGQAERAGGADRAGQVEKTVSYWAMRYRSGQHVASSEVDEISWHSGAEADSLLTYHDERGVLADFLRLPAPTATVLLIRHAKAGRRSGYRGEDRLRPLDKIGRRQARDSAPFVAAFAPQRIFTAEPLRCRQTVEPLATHLDLDIVQRREFSDDFYAVEPRQTRAALVALLDPDSPVAICSQGGTIPSLLADLAGPHPDWQARKGSLWVLSFADDLLLAADYYPHPQV